MVRWLYTAVVRPSLAFAALVWWPAVCKDWAGRLLGKVQRLACLAMTGAFRTTPTGALEVILNLPPLDLFLQGEAGVAAIRLRGQGNWALTHGRRGHCSIYEDAVTQCPMLGSVSDSMTAAYNLERSCEVEIPSKEKWLKGGVRLGGYQVWYTDGSKMDSGTGAGVHRQGNRLSVSVPLGKCASVFQAEVFAIAVCSRLILEENGAGRSVAICSDSQAAIKAIMAPRTTSRLVRECQLLMKQLSLRRQVKLLWVPGHVGIRGNEIADELARKGAERAPVGPEPIIGISHQYAKARIKENVFQEHCRRWRGLEEGLRQARDFIKGPDPGRARRLLGLGRDSVRFVIGLLTGHNTLRRHLALIGTIVDSRCRKCGEEEESSFHILCECHALAGARLRLLGQPYPDRASIREVELGALLHFGKSAGLL